MRARMKERAPESGGRKHCLADHMSCMHTRAMDIPCDRALHSTLRRKWPAEFDYSLNAPKGHLPLTNCLRGTQLFKAILEHPAFERPAEDDSSSPQPDWLNQTETKFSL